MSMTVPELNVGLAFRQALRILEPKKDMGITKWADTYRMLPSTASSEPGQWRTDRFPFLADIMNSLGQDSEYKETAFMKSSQVGGTECIINCMLYYVHQKPQSILSVQPTVAMAEKYSKQRIGPSIADSPSIDAVMNKRYCTILEKVYGGGMLMIVGACSASALRSMPLGVLMLDEIDGYPLDVEGEGDPVTLAVRRTTNFPNKRIFYNSTPTEKDNSRIEPLYENSTKKHYVMKCPVCGGDHEFIWSNMRWDKTDDGKLALPIHAYQVCLHCDGIIEESNKTHMMSKEGGARWVAQNPGAIINGFHIPAFYSPLGFYGWDEAVDHWYRAQGDRDKLKTFVNTILGETWEDASNALIYSDVMARKEDYHAKVPKDTILLTCAVDVQPDRFELEVQGWGDQYSKQSIEYRVLWGDTNQQHGVWDELDAYLQQGFQHETGPTMYILCTTIDSGDGGSTDRVYEFCADKSHRCIFAIKGGSEGNNAPIIKAPTKNRMGGWLYVLGVDQLKENVYHSLRQERGEPGYWSFPSTYTEEYFMMLTSEKKIYTFKNGIKRYKWTKTRDRNEALDIACYNRAALEILQPDWGVLKGTLRLENLHVSTPVTHRSNEVQIYEEEE